MNNLKDKIILNDFESLMIFFMGIAIMGLSIIGLFTTDNLMVLIIGMSCAIGIICFSWIFNNDPDSR